MTINEPEAETVRYIFRSYCELGSVRLLAQRLGDEGIRSKLHHRADGSTRGGKPQSRGALYLMLLIGHLKEQRRIATRYDKRASSFIGFVLLGSIRIWARFVHRA